MTCALTVRFMWGSWSQYALCDCSAGFLHEVMTGRCGSSLTAGRCDTSNMEEAAAVFGPSTDKQRVPLISGVINCGGVLADAVLASQSAGKGNAAHSAAISAPEGAHLQSAR